jgi:hypothetical protein
MKKAVLLPVFLTLLVSSFAIELPNRKLYIEGSAEIPAQRTFFMDNFRMEAGALGFEVVNNKADAGYTFRFNAQSHTDDYNPAIKFIVLITLILNDGDRELVSFGWPYADINDMYEYNQYVFFRAAVLIPGISEDDLAGLVTEDDSWRKKWIYLRLSFDYPLTFYVLKNDGLWGGYAVYNGELDDDGRPVDPQNFRFSPLDHKILSKMGAIAGVEFQFLPFMSLEVNFQVSLGDTEDQYFLNMAAGAELKFPIKIFKSFVIEPYGAFLYPLNVSPVFNLYPSFIVGGGVQFGMKMGKSGMLIVDGRYMFLNFNSGFGFTDVELNNPYREPYPLYPEPAVIHYNRHVLGFSIGYKIGLFNRK